MQYICWITTIVGDRVEYPVLGLASVDLVKVDKYKDK